MIKRKLCFRPCDNELVLPPGVEELAVVLLRPGWGRTQRVKAPYSCGLNAIEYPHFSETAYFACLVSFFLDLRIPAAVLPFQCLYPGFITLGYKTLLLSC